MVNTDSKFQILDALPTYGPMYVSVTDNNQPYFSQGFAVRFNKHDGSTWVANFKPGWTAFNEVIELAEPNILVIAGGTSYLMDPDKEYPIDVFGVGYKKVFHASDGRIVLPDESNITVVEDNGAHWCSEMISYGGLEEINLEDNIISGLFYYPTAEKEEWLPFTYNIDSKTLVSNYSGDDIKPLKKWWKFW
jgi:hypothetical protein